MNRFFSFWGSLALALGIAAASACAAEPLHIGELAGTAPDRWQETYQTVRGETVTVDCAVRVPKAEKAPVLRVHWYPSIDPAFQKDFDADSWARQELTVLIKNWPSLIPDAMQPEEYRYLQTFIPLDRVDWDRAYCENSPLTPREAFAALQDVFQRTFLQYGTEGACQMQPSYGITVARLEDPQGRFLWDREIYELTAYEMLRDIPILGLIRNHYPPQNAYGYEDVYWPQFYSLQIERLDKYVIAATIVSEEAVLYDDIPLAGFETVKPQIEKLIRDGRMRKVYQVQLGYMTFLEPDHNLKRYLLVPAWVVDCEFFDSAAEEAGEVDALSTANYTENYRHRQIVFNGQTGMVIDPENRSRDRCDAPGIVTWEDVR